MAKSNRKTTVFRGRKDKYEWPTVEQLSNRLAKKLKHTQPTTKSLKNLAEKLTKTQRKDAARTERSLKDRSLQNNLVKQHIGAGLIFGLVSRCEQQVAP